MPSCATIAAELTLAETVLVDELREFETAVCRLE